MKVVVLDDYADAMTRLGGLDRLAAHDVTIYRDSARSADELVGRLKDADAIVLIQQRCRLGGDVIRRLPKLKFISQTGRNFSHLDLNACEQAGIVVSAKGAGSANVTAELTWALILASVRDIPRQVERLKRGQWLDSVGVALAGKILGVYAFGKIGSIVAGYGKAFGMRVICHGREGSLARARAAGLETEPDRENFFRSADVLCLHLPLVDGTRGIVTAADMALMKPTALLVNTSRADIIEPGALSSALVLGRPGHAAVDVYEQEPVLDGDHPLLKLPNALCTPHLGYSVDESYRQLLEVAVNQILAYADGKPTNVVVPDAAGEATAGRNPEK